MNTRNTNAAAWGWVLQNTSAIRGAARRLSHNTGLDTDDFHSALLVRVVEKWSSYDSTQAAAVTWVWWQARAVRSSLLDAHSRRRSEVELEPVHHPVTLCHAEASLLVQRAHALALPDEWQAAVAYADGLTGEELGAACGCAPFSARRRVARLRARLEAA